MTAMGRLFKRRRALSDAEADVMEMTSTLRAPKVLVFENCSSKTCGSEAACHRLNITHFTCICPHDKSQPTEDLLCPLRRTVPPTPRVFHNIIIPSSGGNLTLANVTSTEQTTREARPPNWVSNGSHGLLVGFAATTVIAFVLALAICMWKRKEIQKCFSKSAKTRKSTNSPCPLNLTKGLLVAERYTANPQYTACTSIGSGSHISVPHLPRDSICFLHEIGEGCFGKVYKGEMKREDGRSPDIVAVKVLKDSASSEAEDDFMREVDIMSAFRHANILSLIGVVSRDSGSPWMVFEFMAHGDLTEVLRSNSRQLWKPITGLSPLTRESLLLVATQIASGMRYLASQRFVHRDLACRNCLVGNGLTVKIADFGMSRDVYTCDYYKLGGGSRMLPVRWMSPESLLYGRFTLESDVWSYGVVLWEIYSLGKQPYYGHSNDEVIKLILQGIMLIPPDDCPPVICELMRSCWKTEPKDRIRFPNIHERLQKAWGRAVEASDNIPLTQPPSIPRLAMSTFKPNNVPFPRPPGGFPLAQFQPVELLDTENYLLPTVPPASQIEYLQTLPDP